MTENKTDNKTNTKLTSSRKDWVLLGTNIILFIIIFSIYNDQLPDVVGSHYNVRGEQDGSMTKASLWLLYGGLGVALPTVLSILRSIDPRKKNYVRFEDAYYLIRWIISLFLHGVFLLLILQNLNDNLPISKLVMGGIGILWMVIGNRMGQLRSNFFIGIKTPWVLMDESNWRATHRLGGQLWFITGLIMLISAFLIPIAGVPYVLIGCVLISSLIPTVYSYILYARKSKEDHS